ncbi:MAG TPA: histone deacetylase family protein [Candidatus Hydrogenedentes bacterium]|nr:histone deacetylase family protein [Candidatus Hydrogenedentota bacterium]HQM47171.1 histone deacetylase family protein [Candidatus Hydrogenedentota bacterium]
MFRIRAIHGNAFFLSHDRVEQVQHIFRETFPGLAEYADKLPSLLHHPTEHGFRSGLLVAEGALGRVDAFALVLYFSEVKSAFLDFVATRPGVRSRGIGGALYETVREYCSNLGARGLYLEVEPDEPELTRDPAALTENRQRIRFYERYGVRVVDGTQYHLPVGSPPSSALLLFDGLGRHEPLSRSEARQAVELILTRRFGHVADREYVRRVVSSFQDDPVRFRPVRLQRSLGRPAEVQAGKLSDAFAMVRPPRHEIHHVKERGYFEHPIRVQALCDSLDQTGLFAAVPLKPHGRAPLAAVHDAEFLEYLREVCGKIKEGRPVYPDTFPLRTPERRPKRLLVQAGYYCLDADTPLYRNAYIAARDAADAALTAAGEILAGRRLAYAVCRPPGHHAGRRFFGGFCYFNNAAIAAQHLSAQARTAILDIDFHHGNGTQDIFYDRDDVFTVSIHGHPDYAYPYFTGFADETGAGKGLGFNRNFPLPPRIENEAYLRIFDRSLDEIGRKKPEILVISLGFDTMKGDPTGNLLLRAEAFRTMGKRLARAGLPLLVVQEGGYSVRNIRRAGVAFFSGCAACA